MALEGKKTKEFISIKRRGCEEVASLRGKASPANAGFGEEERKWEKVSGCEKPGCEKLGCEKLRS